MLIINHKKQFHMTKTGTYNSKGEKWCNKCKAYHHISAFGKNSASNDSIGYVCTAQTRIANESAKERKNSVSIDKDRGEFFTNQAIQALRLTLPDLKLANPYEYKRPDEWDIYQKK